MKPKPAAVRFRCRARTPFMVLGDFNAIAGASMFVDLIVSGKAAPHRCGAPRGSIGIDLR